MAGEKANPKEHVLRQREDGYYEVLTRGDLVTLCSKGMAAEEVLFGWKTSSIQSVLLGSQHNKQFIALGGKHIGKGLVSMETLLRDAIESQDPEQTWTFRSLTSRVEWPTWRAFHYAAS